MRKNLLYIVFALFLVACGGANENEQSTTEDSVKQKETPKSAISKDKKNPIKIEIKEIQEDGLSTIQLSVLPQSFGDLKNIQATLQKSPEGAGAYFLVAMNLYSLNKEDGTKALVSACTGSALQEANGEDSYEGKALLKFELARLKEQLQRYPKLATAYFNGATPQNQYQAKAPYQVQFTRVEDRTGGGKKLFVKTAGADSPRPMRVAQDEQGLWKVEEYSSVLSGIKK